MSDVLITCQSYNRVLSSLKGRHIDEGFRVVDSAQQISPYMYKQLCTLSLSLSWALISHGPCTRKPGDSLCVRTAKYVKLHVKLIIYNPQSYADVILYSPWHRACSIVKPYQFPIDHKPLLTLVHTILPTLVPLFSSLVYPHILFHPLYCDNSNWETNCLSQVSNCSLLGCAQSSLLINTYKKWKRFQSNWISTESLLLHATQQQHTVSCKRL